jgi:hypothetical protein
MKRLWAVRHLHVIGDLNLEIGILTPRFRAGDATAERSAPRIPLDGLLAKGPPAHLPLACPQHLAGFSSF